MIDASPAMCNGDALVHMRSGTREELPLLTPARSGVSVAAERVYVFARSRCLDAVSG
jgi:hypothetical protein